MGGEEWGPMDPRSGGSKGGARRVGARRVSIQEFNDEQEPGWIFGVMAGSVKSVIIDTDDLWDELVLDSGSVSTACPYAWCSDISVSNEDKVYLRSWPISATPILAKPTLASPFPTLAKSTLTCGVVVLCVVVVVLWRGYWFHFSWCGVSRVGVGFKVLVMFGAPGPPFHWTALPLDRPKFLSFFSLSRCKIRSFLPSLGVFSWNFGGV